MWHLLRSQRVNLEVLRCWRQPGQLPRIMEPGWKFGSSLRRGVQFFFTRKLLPFDEELLDDWLGRFLLLNLRLNEVNQVF